MKVKNWENVFPLVEKYFKEKYKESKTEARALIYKNEELEYLIKFPESVDTSVSTTSDVEFTVFESGVTYHLCADFHSHHLMGAFFSSQDDMDDSRIASINPEILFGVFSWKDKDVWKLRKLKGKEWSHEIT